MGKGAGKVGLFLSYFLVTPKKESRAAKMRRLKAKREAGKKGAGVPTKKEEEDTSK